MARNEDKENKSVQRGTRWLYFLLTIGVGAAIVGGIINIQWVNGEFWRSRSADRTDDIRPDPARRGNIYSSDGKILATTVTECNLYLDLLDTVVLNEKGNPKYDKHGALVESGPIVDSNFTRYLDTVCQMLAESMRLHSADYYRDRIMTDRERNGQRTAEGKRIYAHRCFLVERQVPYSVWLEIRNLPGWKPGVVRQVDGESVVRQTRAHIYGNMARNTIGFPNQRGSRIGFTGLEGAYDSLLRGQDGQLECRRLTMGIWLPAQAHGQHAVPRRTDLDNVDTVIIQPRIDGRSIVSTIDTRYQDIAENALRASLMRYGGESGCAILMEKETGYVLACANLSVDTSVHDYRELRDRNVAVSDMYEPGSTFKTVILTAMLSDPGIKIDTALQFRAGTKDFGGKDGVIKDDHQIKDAQGRLRDSLNVREIIEQSSNVGMCDLGWYYYRDRRDTLRMLVEQIFPYQNLNPDVVSRQYNTRINDLHRSRRDFLNFCYGYSTRVSPLQIITFYNALAADGRMVKPQFCKGVLDGDRLIANKPIVLNPKICSKETARTMRTMLEGVVERGTGTNIRNNTYGIAGKTGTAVHNYTHRSLYNASFAGYFPSENPRYTCLVVMERVPSYGRQAAEVFKSISDCVVAMDKGLSDGAVRSVWPRLEEDSTKASQRPVVARGDQSQMRRLYKLLRQPFLSADSSARWVVYHPATDSTIGQYYPYIPTAGVVPNCIGMTARDAVELLQQQGYHVVVKGYGKVASQQPSAGSKARNGATVVVTLKH